jgi:hypothetical protein
MHARRWCVGVVRDAEELAHRLIGRTWTLCTGFELDGYLFLNDSTSEDGAQEYAILKRPVDPGGPFVQVESIAFGWCSPAQALEYVRAAIAGDMDGTNLCRQLCPQLDTPTTHGCCHLWA